MVQAAQRQTPKDKRRRRRQMAGLILGYVVLAICLAWFLESRATTTIIFVRHADTDTDMAAAEADPELNARGRARAVHLADFVRDIDVVASVDAIYVSEYRRTQQTAAPLAERLGIEPTIADHYDVEAFMAEVLREHKGEIVLIVTHRDVIAPLVEELHGSKNVAEIAPDDFDNFFIVTSPSFGKVKTLQLHYGEPSLMPKHSDGF
jgi:broad specificity phosphatase PhoE